MTTDANNDFERKIKSSLEGYEAPFVAGDWEDMDAKLNTLPKSSPSFRFNWNFSFNIYIALIGCASFFFLMYKLGGASGTAASLQHRNAEKTVSATSTNEPKPGAATTSIKTNLPGAKAIPVKETGEAAYADPEGPPVALGPSSENADQEPGAIVNGNLSRKKENQPISADPIATPLLNPDSPKVIVFGDMIDPKKGLIYNTKEKIGSGNGETQTKVNLGWNDYVIYDPTKIKGGDSSKGRSDVGSNKTDTENSGMKSERRRIGRRGRNKEESEKQPITEPTTTAPAEVKAAPATTQPAESKEVGDTVKRVKQKNPKLKTDHSILDPY
jgi:hypothetical protein